MDNLHEKQNIEIARHDERIKVVEGFVEEMRKNHLPHIYEGLKKIQIQLAVYAGGVVVAIWVIENFLIK